MDKKWNGLIILLLGVASAAVAVCVPELTRNVKIILFCITALFAVCGYIMLKRASRKQEDEINEYTADIKYEVKDRILSAPESELYSALIKICNGKYEVLPQIALVSLVNKLNYNSYRNELFRIVDFVITDKNFRPLVVIELNDKSHQRKDRMERDKKVAEILKKASIPLVVFIPENLTFGEIRKVLSHYLR